VDMSSALVAVELSDEARVSDPDSQQALVEAILDLLDPTDAPEPGANEGDCWKPRVGPCRQDGV